MHLRHLIDTPKVICEPVVDQLREQHSPVIMLIWLLNYLTTLK